VALTRSRSRRSSIDIWPGFVDALAQLLMVIIFILLVFTVGQFYLSDALSGRDLALKELQQKISALADELALERQTSEALRGNATTLVAQLKAAQDERDALSAKLSAAGQVGDAAKDLQAKLSAEQQTSQAARAQVEELTAEIVALRDQLAKVAAALDVSNNTIQAQQGRPHPGGDAAARPGLRRLEGDFREDPARHQLGAAGRRPYRPPADPQR
jgi:chemotaxis protein MotB